MMQWTDVLLQRGADFQRGGLTTIIVIAVLIIDILIIVNVWKSHKTTLVKVVWTLVILFTSIIGWILYFLLGREK